MVHPSLLWHDSLFVFSNKNKQVQKRRGKTAVKGRGGFSGVNLHLKRSAQREKLQVSSLYVKQKNL